MAPSEINDSPYMVNPMVPIVQDPEDFLIIVAGAESALGGKLIYFPGHAMREQAVAGAITRRDGTSANWGLRSALSSRRAD